MSNRRPNVYELEKQVVLLQQHIAMLNQLILTRQPPQPIHPQQIHPQQLSPQIIPTHQRTMHAPVPLRSAGQYGMSSPSVPSAQPRTRGRFQTRRYVPVRDVNPVNHPQEDDREISPYLLSDLLQEGEEITMRIIVGSEADGYPKFASAILLYDGSQLTVKSCEKAPELIGKASEKAGALLYQFMDLLHEKGLLRRKFSVAPWKLCFVTRNGESTSLNKLRKQQRTPVNAANAANAASE